jgi:hypothetical protein
VCKAHYYGEFCQYITLDQGCYNSSQSVFTNASFPQRTCLWNWYLAQFEIEEFSVIPISTRQNSDPLLLKRIQCGAVPCNGHGTCAHFGQDDYSFEHQSVGRIAGFQYTTTFAGLRNYQTQQELYHNQTMYAQQKSQHCICANGWGVEFCQERVCEPNCAPDGYCDIPEEISHLPTCKCFTTANGICLKTRTSICDCFNKGDIKSTSSTPTNTFTCEQLNIKNTITKVAACECGECAYLALNSGECTTFDCETQNKTLARYKTPSCSVDLCCGALECIDPLMVNPAQLCPPPQC